MNNVKSFFKIVKYEFVRLFRNKMVIFMLLGFAILALFVLSFLKMDNVGSQIAVFTDGMSIEELSEQQIVLDSVSGKEIVYVETVEQGKEMVNSYEALFFLCFNKETKPVTATLYYDSASIIGKSTKEDLNGKSNKIAYDSITAFLKEYGIKINENYFNLITFQPSNNVGVRLHQLPFSMELTVCLSFVIMFGLAFSISRDNETNISKNLSYLPIGLNRYLIAKIFTYFALGMAEMMICLLMGQLFFGIEYQMNIFLIWLLSSFFILSIIMLGLLCSCCKNQIATALICTLSIVVPMFAVSMMFIPSLNWVLSILLYTLPVTLFITFLNGIMYSGLIIWWHIPVFIVQMIAYYAICYLIMKKRAN